MRNIIIVHKSPWESMLRIAFSTACSILVIGVGALLQSTAMQWFGFIGLLLIGVASGTQKTVTVEEARAQLDKIEKELRR